MPGATVDSNLTKLWGYGRVIKSSTGFHAEYTTDFLASILDDYSLMYLGMNEEEALCMIIRVTQQHIYLDSMRSLISDVKNKKDIVL